MAPPVIPVVVAEEPQGYEAANVHDVYDQIASHFSSTRYKVTVLYHITQHILIPSPCIEPWPVIATFLASIPTGWIGLDSGTGNGKYLPLPLDRPNCILTIGLDRSIRLLEIARNAGGAHREVVHGDALGHGWRNGIFVGHLILLMVKALNQFS